MGLRCDALHTRDVLSSSPPPSLTIPSHYPRSRNENSLETPPNAVSTHHLSINSQQMQIRKRTDAKKCKNNPNHPETNQNIGQDIRECGEPTPPRTSPLPFRQGMWAYTKRRSHRKTAPPLSHDRRQFTTDSEDLAANRVEVRVPNRFRGGAATSSFYNVFRVLICTIPRL